jgi:diguanylate cyclase (GGDEF)-like protein
VSWEHWPHSRPALAEDGVQPDLPLEYQPFAIRPGKRILIVDHDDFTAEHVVEVLSAASFVCTRAKSGEEALHALHEGFFDLVLLTTDMPGLDGYETCRRLRLDMDLPPTPVILLGGGTNGREVIHGLEQGADDFIGRPYNTDEFLARVKALLIRSERHIDANPLTTLPGNRQIRAEMARRIALGEPFAVYYLDIDDFKPFNDCYGYDAGDEAIRLLARILTGIRARIPLRAPFVGHIGGDDFVLLAESQRKEEVCQEIIRAWDAEVSRLYNEEDRRHGCIVTVDRRGERQQFPIMRLSIGVVTNEYRTLDDPRKVAEIASETKSKAKETRGANSYYIDRRRG